MKKEESKSDIEEKYVYKKDRDYSEPQAMWNRFLEPAVRQAILELKLPSGSRGLDAGCGPGLTTLWLAEAVAPDGNVIGLDITPAQLEFGRKIASPSSLELNIEFKEGDINRLPFAANTFDWVWCADTLVPELIVKDPIRGVKELARVVKHEGIVAISFFSDYTILPGYPEVEMRLKLASFKTMPQPSKPDYNKLRVLGWLQKAGLQDPCAQSFVVGAQAPLDENTRNCITWVFQWFWDHLQPNISSDDWEEYQRLCLPESPDFILNMPDYYCFMTYTLFYATIKGGGGNRE
jgi:demethylmenaquinone methyltransferase/2-methoxy-6-polyprenyl-1,4-benzoquinol methylase